ncbi:MAG: DUF1501 domain-containing protein [Bryobacteraceae bacterium]|nr:DUF1501 domain-containing protein [Bryobacteraceae bacterium]MDW8379395.1 DUF1501 domain-containing protein [Bryobacterales bacterium]
MPSPLRPEQLLAIHSRRAFLRDCAGGIGAMALAHLLARDGYSAPVASPSANPLAPKPPHFTPKAKNVIFLFMEGAPSQMDLFDEKPELRKWHGKPLPASLTKDLKLAFIKPTATVLASPFRFRRYGQCGMELSELLPNLGSCADEITLIRSMYSEAFNHHPGQLFLFTGSMVAGRPTMGAWIQYGLGSESQNLPGFVVLASGVGTSAGSDNWSSGFLPSSYAGTVFRSQGDPILYLSNPAGVNQQTQRERLDLIRQMNLEHLERTGDLEIASRIHSYELAYRMQMSAPELIDFSQESPQTLEAYGLNNEKTRAFGANCLLARRLVERGVRFVLLMHASWDHHSGLAKGLPRMCEATDQPAAALLKDLKQRGLLQETLVIWGGEFGRTPLSEIRRPDDPDSIGRDHHPNGYSMWMAGGGIKAGFTIGKTDELALQVVEDRIHVHDLQATILHCLGMDHTKLTYRHMGRDFRLTDIHGEVVQKILA